MPSICETITASSECVRVAKLPKTKSAKVSSQRCLSLFCASLRLQLKTYDFHVEKLTGATFLAFSPSPAGPAARSMRLSLPGLVYRLLHLGHLLVGSLGRVLSEEV